MAAREPTGRWKVLCALCAIGLQLACAPPPTSVKDSQRVNRDPLEPQMNFTPRWVYLRSVDSALARHILWDQAKYAWDTWHNFAVVAYTDEFPFYGNLAPSFDFLGPACGIVVRSEPEIRRALLPGLDSVDLFPVTKMTLSGNIDSTASFEAITFLSSHRPTTDTALVVLVPRIGYTDRQGMVTPRSALGITPGVLDQDADGSIWLASVPVTGAANVDKEPVPLSHEMIHLFDKVTDPSVQSPPLVQAWEKICHVFSGTFCEGSQIWIWNADLENPRVINPEKYTSGELTLIQTSGSSESFPRNQCTDARTYQRFLRVGTNP